MADVLADMADAYVRCMGRVGQLERALEDAQGKFDRADVLDHEGRRGRANEYRIMARQVIQEALDG